MERYFDMKVPDAGELQNIYNALADETSRQIYRHRLLYSLLGDHEEFMKAVPECLLGGEQPKPLKLCCYGAGEGGRWVARHWLDLFYDVEFMIDQYKTGTFYGKPIISLEDFLKLPDHKEYFVAVTMGAGNLRREVMEELKRSGLRCAAFLHDERQYFEVGALCHTDLRNEYFVDAGAFDGKTTEDFLEHFENGHAYVFEPNPVQFEITKQRLQGYSRQVELFPYGAYDESKTVRFDPYDEDNRGSARITQSGSIEVEARRLDDVLGDRKVTFIKMDVEGSELAALRGAERIIREQRPKLAICAYHKPEDMWELPGQILKYHPDYKLYLRHYTILDMETVLYAV